MIYKRGWQRTLSEYELAAYLKERDVINPERVAQLIVGRYDERWHQFTLIDNSYISDETTLLQRVNRIWFVPLYILTMPFQWLVKGHVGLRNNSKLAKLMAKLTGLE